MTTTHKHTYKIQINDKHDEHMVTGIKVVHNVHNILKVCNIRTLRGSLNATTVISVGYTVM